MAKLPPQNIDLDNQEFQTVWNMLQHTRRSIFMTGKAGTGKSTFLKYICAHTKKKYVVLAPTGIAAVNVGGQTLHSFFKIPFKPLLPDDPDYTPRRLQQTQRYTKRFLRLVQKLDLIIIDEISMVRCDIIDFIDRVLRVICKNMREPFGGKQLLFVGDIFQLEPVVTRDMKEILRLHYKQFFFFNAHVFSQLGLIPIELRKIYRQTDSDFISMLDRVRVSHATMADMALLNSRVNPDYKDDGSRLVMTLATRRDTVDAINELHLAALKTPEVTYEGEITGTFPDSDLPTNKDLTLKQGAQVIFIRNDKDNRWVNGTLGKVAETGKDYVRVELENGTVHEVEPELWENIRYSYDEKEKKVIEEMLGSFKQYPIKPAWALTVHKSQGLTFNNVVIDFAGGAFTSGQTYVALSRCTSLEGMTLLRPLSERDIIVSTSVSQFSLQFNNMRLITDALERERANALYTRAIFAFDHDNYSDAVDYFFEAMKVRNVLSEPVAKRFIKTKFRRLMRQAATISDLEAKIENQAEQLRGLAMEFTAMGDQAQGYGDLNAAGQREGVKLDEIMIASAMANYKKALRLWPECAAAKIGRARLLFAIGETDSALDDLNALLKADKGHYDALMLKADISEKQRDTAATTKCLKRAVKYNRMRPEPHERLADIYDRIGLEDRAEEHREAAKRLRQRAEKKKNKPQK